MTCIILIRHGQTAWNRIERFRGQVDLPLDETGLAQAEATARRVSDDWNLVAVYSSPLQRAVQTAQAIARRQGLDVQSMEGFIDINFGQLKGLTLDETKQQWPDIAGSWLEAPHSVTFPRGENLQIVRKRCMAAVRQIIERHPDQTVAVVAHNVVNRVLLCAMLGLDNSHYWGIWQDTCAINVIEWQGDMFIIKAVNDTCHLRQVPTAPRRQGKPMDRDKVTIYTDGSCEPNPGPGGWAALLLCEEGERVLTGGEYNTTNNRMELQAAIAALGALDNACDVEFHTDSTYLQQGITKWLPRWIQRGWRKSDRKPVLNADLWKKLHALDSKHDIHWHWVRAHSGDRHNSRVDRLAYGAIPRPDSPHEPS